MPLAIAEDYAKNQETPAYKEDFQSQMQKWTKNSMILWVEDIFPA